MPFGRILNNLFEEIYIFDATSLKFTQANHGALKNLGYSLEEITCLTPLDLTEFSKEGFDKPWRT